MTPHRIAPLALSAFTAFACAGQARSEDLTNLDLVTLMNMDVTITAAARRAQAGADAAAAVFVITREDIRRSGATSIPELLRRVPGIQVARVNGTTWAVTARGFNSKVANKLLVLIDGRSIYNSIFSGVFWEDQHLPLTQIERIEIVRGPGGALWGANAVNGVINIVTRRAADGGGLTLQAASGNTEPLAVDLRYAGTAARAGEFGLYAEHIARDSFDPGVSQWKRFQGGGRLDRRLAGGELTLQADLYDNDLGNTLWAGTIGQALQTQGGSLNSAWRTEPTGGGALDVQGYYSWGKQDGDGIRDFNESNLGLGLQYTLARRGRHLLTLGGEWRQFEDRLRGNRTHFAPEHTVWNVRSAYLQDEIHFAGDSLRLTLGAKLEESTFAGAAFQPTVRGWWRVNEAHTLWAAASRAVRTPSRVELQGRIAHSELAGEPDSASTTVVQLTGDAALEPEEMSALEFGWRWRPARSLSLDLALFRHDYRDLVQTQTGTPAPDPSAPSIWILPVTYFNSEDARTQGLEFAADWIAGPWLRLRASSTLFDMDISHVSGLLLTFDGVDPRYTHALQARLDLPRRFELDLNWRRVAALDQWSVPAYDSLGLRLGWRTAGGLELSFAVDTLLDREHVEFYDEQRVAMGAALGRSFLAKVSWQPQP